MKQNKKKIIARTLFLASIALIVVAFSAVCIHSLHRKTSRPSDEIRVGKYYVKEMPTPNISKHRNDVQGIILHHTADRSAMRAIEGLRSPKRQASCHVVIDTDGTRYVLAEPTAVTWHAGYSMLNGRERCNDFTVGIEFQGNTTVAPLTEDQISSAIDYILPIMKKYNIPIENIVTHEQVRHSWIVKYPEQAKAKHVSKKVDITQKEYQRFMRALEKRMKGQ